MPMAMCSFCGKRTLCSRVGEEKPDAQRRMQSTFCCDGCLVVPDPTPAPPARELDCSSCKGDEDADQCSFCSACPHRCKCPCDDCGLPFLRCTCDLSDDPEESRP